MCCCTLFNNAPITMHTDTQSHICTLTHNHICTLTHNHICTRTHNHNSEHCVENNIWTESFRLCFYFHCVAHWHYCCCFKKKSPWLDWCAYNDPLSTDIIIMYYLLCNTSDCTLCKTDQITKTKAIKNKKREIKGWPKLLLQVWAMYYIFSILCNFTNEQY